MEDTTLRVCTKCKKEKPLSQFNETGVYGRKKTACKVCTYTYVKKNKKKLNNMTNAEILKKAIAKATRNGYVGEGRWINEIERESYKDKYLEAKVATHPYNYFDIVFDHDFAKAFWEDSRDNWICYKEGKWQRCHMNQSFSSETPFVYPLWQYHLMHMVLEKNPLTYLEKFL